MPMTMSRRKALTLAGSALASAQLGRTQASQRGDIWRDVRRQFTFTDNLSFFNTGAIGACPERVIDATLAAWRRLEKAPVHETYGPLLEEADAVRERAADFLGCEFDEVTVTGSTTDGMNMVAGGLDLKSGDRVLTTSHEHGGGFSCWKHLHNTRGVEIDQVDLPAPADDQDALVELFAEAIRPTTRVVSLSHVNFTTGLRMPVAEIGRLARNRGIIFVVDGAQAGGSIEVDISRLNCDAYATSGHKWLLGPKGTGLLYIRKSSQQRIRPMQLQLGLSVRTASRGVVNLPSIIGLGEALGFMKGLGFDEVVARNLRMRDALYAEMSQLDRLTVVSPAPGPLASPLLTVLLPAGVPRTEVQQRLRDRHAMSVKILSQSDIVNALRFSCHVYNSAEECRRLVEALKIELA